MIGIVGVIGALTVLSLSLIVTRLATIALSLTGLSKEAARFQSRSPLPAQVLPPAKLKE